ncbi:3-oxoacyl-[acyl-carrier protein] reductase [Methylacidimicrobium cyclopophantes]|uniref:3-oxoacyl-[acyl-carrier protein] reductase n=1 Tax=Methylacidimicrobium cyclopophantes TaxID=1041766 RepID=A0A5E6M8E4_9BACT|nr:SDR family NAD(P)-dependent oxidoreductase [Methylacidimicrobium cyclopophantes]VVM05436.1 3-oxoacyl-[acyl-carrier protein] reductase [Methylacidimicrobium cyclopophantes]
MEQSQRKKVALVTGAGRGLGAALARKLSEDGWSVGVHYHSSKEGGEEIAKRIRTDGGDAEAFGADLGSQTEAQSLVSRVEERFGGLRLLINNSGVYRPVGLLETSEEDWMLGWRSTATAMLFTTLAALPLLRASGVGRIVNIGDSACDRLGAREMALGYHIGKVGVYLLSRSFAREEARHGLTVNVVSPGYLEESINLPPPSKIPAGRFATYDDIWRAIRFLIDEQNGYVTGAHIVVSGGWNLR